ncbi:endonuclease/exonuclease/phosphatase family protein [Babesia caballi]|uniref:Endonuclease/exonuclease/phosphatase family protein n=1 Tax=Babesia caballi TaxID=5871 RepID=A0AAV4LR93_BABCB|nr:endonuclease/exonuclease/phosphatase family protein [Babesia caballi]
MVNIFSTNGSANPGPEESNVAQLSVKDRIQAYNEFLSAPRNAHNRPVTSILTKQFRGRRLRSANRDQATAAPLSLLSRARAQPRSPRPVEPEEKRDLSAAPIRIFVGTWNCAYQDPAESVILKPSCEDTYGAGLITRPAWAISHWLYHVFDRINNPFGEGGHSHNHPAPPDAAAAAPTSPTREHQNSRGTRPADSANRDSETVTSHPPENGSVLPPRRAVQKSHAPIAQTGNATARHAVASDHADEGSYRSDSSDPVATPPSAAPAEGATGPNPCAKAARAARSASASPRSRMMRQTTLSLEALTEDDHEPLGDWIPAGYDVYIVSLQETLSCSMLGSITKYLEHCAPGEFVRVPLEDYKLSGHGDGAILHRKSTSIAAWIRRSLLDAGAVRVGMSKAIRLSRINRSKGVVTFQLDVLGQAVCVVGCHLPTRLHDREKAAAFIMRKLCEVYGAPGASLEEVFHHILWTGDFNFRLGNISAEGALELLNANSLEQLFEHDELRHGYASTFAAMDFEEAAVRFLPTYKKRDGRGVADCARAGWADAVYETRFETQWYKGGNVKERVPSWTDRVLKWSLPDLRACLLIDEATYRAAEPRSKSFLLASDHTPVGCGLAVWPLRDPGALAPRKNLGSPS